MKLVRCENGHFFDASKTKVCPHCGVVVSMDIESFNATVDFEKDTASVKGYLFNQKNDNAVLNKFNSCKDTENPFIFISYSHKDAEKVKPYFDILENNHFRYWYDEGLPSGKDFYEQIAQHIKCSVQVVLFLSENSQNSENVKDEVHYAYKYKKNILVVYIEKIEQLNSGLELALDRKQNLLAYNYHCSDLERKFYDELSKEAVKEFDIEPTEIQRESFVELSELSEKYTDIKLLSKSKMSETYSAIQNGTGSKVIIKHVEFGNNQNGQYLKDCIANEKKALGLCSCPFLPFLIDYFETDNKGYIVENFIHGESPSVQKSYSEEFVIDYAIKIAHILKYLYYCGIVHCDIKPSNTMVNEFGDVFLLDLGSCVFKHDNKETRSAGTLGFAAPEQTDKNGVVDFRTDIYGLGRTMLSLLVGDRISSENIHIDETCLVPHDVEMTIALHNPAVKVQYITESLDHYNRGANPILTRIINKMVSCPKEGRYNSFDSLIYDLTKAKEFGSNKAAVRYEPF